MILHEVLQEFVGIFVTLYMAYGDGMIGITALAARGPVLQGLLVVLTQLSSPPLRGGVVGSDPESYGSDFLLSSVGSGFEGPLVDPLFDVVDSDLSGKLFEEDICVDTGIEVWETDQVRRLREPQVVQIVFRSVKPADALPNDGTFSSARAPPQYKQFGAGTERYWAVEKVRTSLDAAVVLDELLRERFGDLPDARAFAEGFRDGFEIGAGSGSLLSSLLSSSVRSVTAGVDFGVIGNGLFDGFCSSTCMGLALSEPGGAECASVTVAALSGWELDEEMDVEMSILCSRASSSFELHCKVRNIAGFDSFAEGAIGFFGGPVRI